MSDAEKIERNDQPRDPSGEAADPLGRAPLAWSSSPASQLSAPALGRQGMLNGDAE